MKIQTGDIAVYRSSNLFGLAIRLFSGPYTHVGFLAVENSDVCIYEAAKGWFFHQAFERNEFNLNEPTLVRIVRLKYSDLFDANCIQANIGIAHQRAIELAVMKWTPYDWGMILSEGVRFILKPFYNLAEHRPLLDSEDRVMCSEGVSAGIWNPAWLPGVKYHGLSLFANDPQQIPNWDTPTEIAESKNVDVIFP